MAKGKNKMVQDGPNLESSKGIWLPSLYSHWLHSWDDDGFSAVAS